MPTPSPRRQQLDAELRRQLLIGERISWSGQPAPHRLTAGLAIWIFAIPWTVFAIAWTGFAGVAGWFAQERTATVSILSVVFPLFGLPFIIVGFWMLAQPIRAMRDARWTIHALTDRRLITLSLARGRKVKSVLLNQIGPIRLRERRGGWGTLTIETHTSRDSEGTRETETFEVAGVPDAARLERLLLERVAPRG